MQGSLDVLQPWPQNAIFEIMSLHEIDEKDPPYSASMITWPGFSGPAELWA